MKCFFFFSKDVTSLQYLTFGMNIEKWLDDLTVNELVAVTKLRNQEMFAIFFSS